MNEMWKPIKGYEGYYEVSNLGRIRSLDHVDKMGRFYKGQIRSNQNSSNGYKQVCLSKDGEKRIARVHRLVAEAFVDNPNSLTEINHIDEDKANNVASNLEWCTRAYNNGYGSKPKRGEQHPMRKLSALQVAEIRKRREQGDLLKHIASDYGISISHACALTTGRYWVTRDEQVSNY